jgi:aspartate ammonia-lyase
MSTSTPTPTFPYEGPVSVKARERFGFDNSPVMPVSVVEALLQVKKAYATAHTKLNLFSKLQGDAIMAACDFAVGALHKQWEQREEREELVADALTQVGGCDEHPYSHTHTHSYALLIHTHMH